MNQCTCYTTPTGDAVICDPCAAGMIEAISNLLPNDPHAADLPNTLTSSEYTGMTALVNGWLDTLAPDKEARKW